VYLYVVALERIFMKKLFLAALLTLSACNYATEVKFSSPPTTARSGDATVITFAISEKSDVEVSVLNSKSEVVRHLAAGVLGGEKAPPEPLKAGLSQSLSWDGKDNFGKPAGGGPFKFRVRAGSQFKFGRFIGDDPYTFGSVDGIACDEDGNVYIEGNRGTHNQSVRTVRKYDSNGAYLKELLPFPPDLTAGSMKEIAIFDDGGNRWLPRSISCLNPEFYERGRLVAASLITGLLFSGTQDVARLAPSGAVAGERFCLGQKPWPVFDAKYPQKEHYGHPWHYHEGTVRYSASPDGKWLYLSGPYPNAEKRKQMDPRFPLGGVHRMRLDGKDEMKLFVSIPADFDGAWTKDGGKLYSGSTPTGFIGSDTKGNVFIPDRQANRIAVYNEEGKALGEIAVKNPYQVAIHPTTGAIYVVRMVCNGWNTHAIAVDKFNNYEKGTTAVATFDKINSKTIPSFAVSVKDGRTVLWMAGSPEGLIALQDTGNAIVPIETKFKRRAQAQIDWNRLAVDYQRDELYVADGGNLIWRYDGKSGEGSVLQRNGKPLAAVDLAVGFDGLLYIRTGESFSGPLERYTHDLQAAPTTSGTNSLSKYIYSRFGIGNCEKGLGVGPNGECYISFMYDWTKYCVAGFGKDGKPIKGKYLQGKVGNRPATKPDANSQYPSDLDSAVIGPIPQAGGGIRVDLKGNIYLGLAVRPKGQKIPESLAKLEVNRTWTGSVVKFGPGGGTVLGVPDAETKQADVPRIDLENKLTAENALNVYWGLGSISGAGPGGNSSCCVCRVPRFDVDRFGRLALPSSYTSSVMLYDNAGNVIAEVGKYGNFDVQFINPETSEGKLGKPTISLPEIPMAFPTGAGFSENHLYVNDTANRRVVRIDKYFAAEAINDIR
jgi:hypothetical protein